jgi:hypothetical protein
MQFHLFGAATPSGEAFRRQAASTLPSWSLSAYSRQPISAAANHYPADFNAPDSFLPAGELDQPAIWISFAPIWLLAPFLEKLATDRPETLQSLQGLIACSSSSSLTKRFAANHFDRELSARLTTAENQLLSTCRRQRIPCRILRPTLVYGKVGPYCDRNLSRLARLLHWLPLFPLPVVTGLRQPIHASQLSAVALRLAQQLDGPGWDPSQPERITVGGDSELTYESMIRALQHALPPGHPAKRSRLLLIPNRLFFLLAVPLLLRSPKSFEAAMRVAADLSGFTPAHLLLGEPANPFPVLPLAY